MRNGMVYLFTGEGKGKTSTSFWTAVRAALSGKRVVVVQWYKEARWRTAEQEIGKKIDNLEVFLMGKGFFKLPTDHASENEHKLAAEKALEFAMKKLGMVDVLVLDEVVNAVADGLIREESLLGLIKSRGKTHVVLSGRGASKRLVDEADLVTEMKKIKHPFDEGVKAIKGLDY